MWWRAAYQAFDDILGGIVSDYEYKPGSDAGAAIGILIVVLCSAVAGVSVGGLVGAVVAALIGWGIMRVIIDRIILPLIEDLTDLYRWVTRR